VEGAVPLFMDRHDIPGATAKDVAEAHMSDVELAHEYGVQFLSYWFDADTGGVFCFANAPAQDNLQAVHRASHGLVANEIIAVSEGDMLRFLGRIQNPRDHTELSSPFRTILFTDLEGSTALLESVGQASFMPILEEHDVIIRRALATCRGREVKHTGDGIMAAFDEVADALDCALAVQSGFAERNARGAEHDLKVRVGMAAGEPVDHNDDIYGSTVVLASRICDAAVGGQSLVSDVVAERGGAHGFAFDDLGPKALKGLAEPVSVYALLDSTG
jgi:class 3 adenylate cyclase